MRIDEKGFLVFDVETSGLYNNDYPAYDKQQAWIVQFAGQILDNNLKLVREISLLLKPPFPDAVIEEKAEETHGISLAECWKDGVSPGKVRLFLKPVFEGKLRLVGHNVNFDSKFLHRFTANKAERAQLIEAFKQGICTMRSGTSICKLPPTKAMLKYKNLKYKNPKLEELHEFLFNEKFVGAHDALNDVKATVRCLREMIKRGAIRL
jgi:DNA polymerase III epsilon subunit-like protein